MMNLMNTMSKRMFRGMAPRGWIVVALGLLDLAEGSTPRRRPLASSSPAHHNCRSSGAALDAAATAAARVRRASGLVLAGGVAAALAKTAVAPLERLKLLRQLGEASGEPLGAMVATILRTEGPAGFWRGNVANVARAFPQKGVLLMSADVWREALTPLCARVHVLPSPAALSGALAGATSVLVSYPLDVIFTRQAGRIVADRGGRASIIATAREAVRAQGLAGLYVGAGFTLLSSLPYEGIKFGTYALLCRALAGQAEGPGPPEGRVGRHLRALVAGAGAGAAAHASTYPFDTIRRHLQMRGTTAGLGTFGSALACGRTIAKGGGLAAFYKGLPITVVRTVPNTGLQFLFYEVLKRALVDVRDAGGAPRTDSR